MSVFGDIGKSLGALGGGGSVGDLAGTVAGFIGATESADAQLDALREAQALNADVYRTTLSQNAPFVQAGTGAIGSLERSLLGTPAGQQTPFDFDGLRSAIEGLEFNNQQTSARKAQRGALSILDTIEAPYTNPYGTTERDRQQSQNQERELTKRLNVLGLELSDFPAPEPTPATGPSLDDFDASPEAQLYGSVNSRALQDVEARLAARGLSDSGAGREALLNEAERGQQAAFQTFLGNRGALVGTGQNAIGMNTGEGGRFAGASADLLNQQGIVRGTRDIAVAESAADLIRQIEKGAMQIAGAFA